MTPIRTILHPTDFSPCSSKAYRLACELAQDSGARLVALYVKPLPAIDPAEIEFDFAFDEFEDPDSETIVEDVELGQHLQAFAQADPYLRIERRVESGDPASEILRVIEEISADLVVMGTHGIAASDRKLLGNVARRVLSGVRCAIVTVSLPCQIVDAPALGRLEAGDGSDASRKKSSESSLSAGDAPARLVNPAA